jgi:putative MATE family efflux protein
LKTSIPYSRVWQIAYPIIIGSIAQNIINVTDTAFLGRLGDVALGAGAIGGLFYLAIVMLGWGFGIGTQIVVARRFGEGALRTIGRVMQHSYAFLFILAISLFLGYQFFGTTILNYLVNSKSILLTSSSFLEYRIWGLFFAHTNFIFNAFFVGIGRTRIISVATIIMVLVNVLLDYALIFGHLGLPQMGVQGAALASVIAEGTSVLVFFVFTLVKPNLKKYQLFTYRPFSLKLLIRLLKVSVPTMFQSFFSFSVWFVFFLIIEKMGETELAISNVVRSIYVVLMVPIMGFASATNSLVSNVIGQGRSNEVIPLIRKIALLSVASVLGLAILCSALPATILSLYIKDINLIAMGVPLVYIVSVSSVFLAIGSIFFYGVSGTGKTSISLLIEIIVLSIYLGSTALLVLWFKASLTVVWSVEMLYGALLIATSYLYLQSKKWVGLEV